ncbi:uncharacterized protein BT62DRAFT_921670 [Guyanagaster necrorhizus]|uniref:Uncharacterized protein n=1 Tax=Guyanagaster necrorhizus TaxID=856835 RepID=A0A9P7VM35_9AGAR|nr:uncharacterized protein BT62DRAFT_921670 [Guyanagaster necrorhizus MCA 3950]KAG7443713.1 hypothetical protein BT62DRAFT_921670 [Guyanagaster necrorhizus MCA 3950]
MGRRTQEDNNAPPMKRCGIHFPLGSDILRIQYQPSHNIKIECPLWLNGNFITKDYGKTLDALFMVESLAIIGMLVHSLKLKALVLDKTALQKAENISFRYNTNIHFVHLHDLMMRKMSSKDMHTIMELMGVKVLSWGINACSKMVIIKLYILNAGDDIECVAWKNLRQQINSNMLLQVQLWYKDEDMAKTTKHKVELHGALIDRIKKENAKIRVFNIVTKKEMVL